MKNEYKLTRYGCYISGFTMAIVATLSPLLFVAFREMYGISYTVYLVGAHSERRSRGVELVSKR